ncbi:hypothetical protein QE418_003419 [Microbacterium testaceum]|uniref:hypothetical protein n=1 Tax=Microbacterium TaxID=33882 RepID=UPI00278366E2|nr:MULTISPECIES: hypothetical protein [Microbacterium]MDQ1113971.1 hypothetical protein [Microbacterium testaceum]MDR6098923.1 hypothetical protein [Microbacterium sp. SORGH_AS_0454]
MSEIQDSDVVEATVGTERREDEHLGRAVTAEERMYVLHSRQCIESGIDVRACAFSAALDRGIDERVWRDHMDTPVVLAIGGALGDLEPRATA